MGKMDEIVLRKAEKRDLPQLLQLINYYIEHTNHNYRKSLWTKKDVGKWFTTMQLPSFDCVVACNGDTVLGYASYGTFRPSEGYDGCIEHSCYLTPGQEGQGLGKRLMALILDSAREKGYNSMIGVIDSANQNSLDFHEHLGFIYAGRLHNVGEKLGQPLTVVFMEYLF